MGDEAGSAPASTGAASAPAPVGAASAPVQLAVSTVILALRPDEAAAGAGASEAGTVGNGVEAADAAASTSAAGAAGPGAAPAGGGLRLWLPLVRRIRAPYRGLFALPGGPLPPELSLEEAAASTLRDATGLVPGYLEQLCAFGRVHRGQTLSRGDDAEAAASTVAAPAEDEDVPAERVVSVVYWASVPSAQAAQVLEEENVRWFPVDGLPPLAFDHREIVDYALTRLRAKVEYSRVAHSFLGEEFTLAQLREVYEAILGRALDPANFRRRVAASRAVIDTGRRLTGTPHRPPRLYRYDDSLAFADSTPPPQ